MLEVDAHGRVVYMWLARPDARNALSAELCDALVASLEEIDQQAEARVVVLGGRGKVFCAGADLSAVSGPQADDFLLRFQSMLERVARFRIPIIARIHGAALGGGLQLATACDFSITTEDAGLGIPSSRLGIVIDLENVQRLVLRVGIPRAREVLMTGATYTGSRAAQAGLVDQAVPESALDEAISTLAERIGSLAPLSVQGTKRALTLVGDKLLGRAPPGGDEVIAALVEEAYRSRDLQEGLQALSEKRDPRFEGR